ncbi:MAG TPA: 30S ribosomal protein S20 [Candidatus Paceibacterota bacterium]
MPITKSAKKAARASLRKRSFNLRRKKAVREEWKELKKLAASDPKKATPQLALVYQAIDKALKRKIIKKATAARRKSQAARLLNRKQAV